MFDKRLFAMAPGIGRLVAAKVACMWVGLLANIGFMVALVALVANLFPALGGGQRETSLSGTSLAWYALVFAVCAAVRYLTTVAATRLGTEAAERVKLALRDRLYRKMLALGPSYSSRVKTADIVQSAGEGIEQIQSFFELFLPQLFYAVLAPITLFFVIWPVNLPAAATLLVCAPLIVVIVGMVAMSAARVFKKYWGRYTDMGAAFLDDMQGLETLKAFDADEAAARDMDIKAERFRVMTMNVLQIQLRSLSAMDLVAYGGTAVGIGVALWRYAAGGAGVGEASSAGAIGWLPNVFAGAAGMPLTLAGVLLIVLLSADFFIPLRQLGSFFHVAMNGMTSTKRIFALLDAPEPERGANTLPADLPALEVVFDAVGYAYSSSAKALDGVTFTARPGQLTAIVGVSGSGKSTAAALLAGMLTGYEGSIRLDGLELRDLDAASLARAVTLVSARSHLFAGSLRDNLLMACPSANDNDLWAALEAARVADFVRTQERGLDMLIEPDAANLSGGQRQRLAIARALLHDSAVMVFDEATSSVDVDSEALILDTMHDLARHGKTVIMITHRMANAVDADQVAVFSHGRVVEAGTHESLLAANGPYADLYHTQRRIEAITTSSASESASQTQQNESLIQESESWHGEAVTEGGEAGHKVGLDAAAPLSTPALIARLLKTAAPLSAYMVGACVAGTIGHLAATFLPVFGVMAAFALAGAPVWGMGVVPAVALMAVCAVLRGVMRYVEQFLNHNVAFRLLALFRSKAFEALRRLAPAKLAGKGKGDLIALITTDVELLEIFFAHTISPVVIALSTTVVYAVALLTLNPWMALLLIAAHLVIGVLVPKYFAVGVQGLGPNIRRQASQLDDVVLDDMRGLDEIIRFGRGEERAADIESRTRALWREHARLSAVNGRFTGIAGILVFALTIAAASLAVGLGMNAGAHAAALTAAFVLIASSFGPTLALSALPANLTSTFAAARRLFALMDETPAVEEHGSVSPRYLGMNMDHVDFGYDGQTVLQDFSLEVPRRGILGVQGPSGRGKSTMLKLLMRYWDPQEGAVMMSGVALPEIDAHHRRRVQAMMTQETHLFDGTIRDNLMMALGEEGNDAGNSGVARHDDGRGAAADPHDAADLDARLKEACRKASVLDLIDSLPDGLDTPVGELGDRLSEGERQRIGLARIFLRDADLVLFDEPTSRLDALNEAVILGSIRELAELAGSSENSGQTDGQTKNSEDGGKARDDETAGSGSRGRAVVLVSHRPSAMRIADTVLRF